MNGLFIIAGVLVLICVIKGYKKGSIKALLSLVIMVAAFLMASFLSPYVERTLSVITPLEKRIESLYEKKLNMEEVDIENSRMNQIRMMEGSDLPDFFKERLISNNNYEMYHKLGTDHFQKYVTGYLSWMTMRICFILLLSGVLYVILYSILFSFDFIDLIKEPGFIHRVMGSVFGLVAGVLWLWILLSIVMIMHSTGLIGNWSQYVEESKILTFFNGRNMLIEWLLMI